MLGVFLSLFKTVDLSARHFRHRRRRPHSCNPQQRQIRSDVWYSSRTKFSPKLIGPAETTEVCSSRRRSRQSSTKPLSSCIRRATSSQSRFLWRWGGPFRETQGEVDCCADILDFYADNAGSMYEWSTLRPEDPRISASPSKATGQKKGKILRGGCEGIQS